MSLIPQPTNCSIFPCKIIPVSGFWTLFSGICTHAELVYVAQYGVCIPRVMRIWRVCFLSTAARSRCPQTQPRWWVDGSTVVFFPKYFCPFIYFCYFFILYFFICLLNIFIFFILSYIFLSADMCYVWHSSWWGMPGRNTFCMKIAWYIHRWDPLVTWYIDVTQKCFLILPEAVPIFFAIFNRFFRPFVFSFRK